MEIVLLTLAAGEAALPGPTLSLPIGAWGQKAGADMLPGVGVGVGGVPAQGHPADDCRGSGTGRQREAGRPCPCPTACGPGSVLALPRHPWALDPTSASSSERCFCQMRSRIR